MLTLGVLLILLLLLKSSPTSLEILNSGHSPKNWKSPAGCLRNE